MKTETKKFIVTVINIVIFVGNAIMSFINGDCDMSTVATVSSVVSGVATSVVVV